MAGRPHTEVGAAALAHECALPVATGAASAPLRSRAAVEGWRLRVALCLRLCAVCAGHCAPDHFWPADRAPCARRRPATDRPARGVLPHKRLAHTLAPHCTRGAVSRATRHAGARRCVRGPRCVRAGAARQLATMRRAGGARPRCRDGEAQQRRHVGRQERLLPPHVARELPRVQAATLWARGCNPMCVRGRRAKPTASTDLQPWSWSTCSFSTRDACAVHVRWCVCAVHAQRGCTPHCAGRRSGTGTRATAARPLHARTHSSPRWRPSSARCRVTAAPCTMRGTYPSVRRRAQRRAQRRARRRRWRTSRALLSRGASVT
eukprot:scaffold103235_cov63-Phaeocystis_antarctica.AAC.3